MKRFAEWNRAEHEATKLLEEHAFFWPPIDPVEIARELNIEVKFVQFSDPKMDHNVSGFFYPAESAIFVNEKEAPVRQTFTIAHELGHKILHEQYLNSNNYQVYYRNASHEGDKPKEEQEADHFAACLLVPKKMLDRYWKIASVNELSEMFLVSKSVIRNRLKSLYKIEA